MIGAATSKTSISPFILRRFASTLSPSSSTASSPSSRIFSAYRYQPGLGHLSLGFSSGLRSICCSNSRWSYGSDWRSRVSVRSQIATSSTPLVERFHRQIATMGNDYLF